MMIRLTTAIFVVASLFAASVNGQLTVNFSAQPGQRDIIDASSSPVPDGNIAAIGYFTAGFNVANNATDYTALQSAWHLFGATTITHLPIPTAQPGRFAGVATQNDPAFDAQKIYMFITETNNAGAVTEYGLFTSTSPTWVFPAHDATPPNQITITSSDVDTFVFGNQVAGTPGSLQLAPALVPEPGSVALLGLGFIVGRLFYRSKNALPR